MHSPPHFRRPSAYCAINVEDQRCRLLLPIAPDVAKAPKIIIIVVATRDNGGGDGVAVSHEIRLRLLSACGSGDAVDVAARAPRITSKMERRDSVVAASSSKKDPAPPLVAPSSLARATIKVRVLDDPNPRDDGLPYLDRLEVSGGDGPVDALANALKKALAPSHPVESQ